MICHSLQDLYVKTQLFSQNWNITSKIFGSNFVLDIESKVDGQWILSLTHCPTLIRKSVVAFLDLKKKIKKFANQFHKDISKYGMLFILISSYIYFHMSNKQRTRKSWE